MCNLASKVFAIWSANCMIMNFSAGFPHFFFLPFLVSAFLTKPCQEDNFVQHAFLETILKSSILENHEIVAALGKFMKRNNADIKEFESRNATENKYEEMMAAICLSRMCKWKLPVDNNQIAVESKDTLQVVKTSQN